MAEKLPPIFRWDSLVEVNPYRSALRGRFSRVAVRRNECEKLLPYLEGKTALESRHGGYLLIAAKTGAKRVAVSPFEDPELSEVLRLAGYEVKVASYDDVSDDGVVVEKVKGADLFFVSPFHTYTDLPVLNLKELEEECLLAGDLSITERWEVEVDSDLYSRTYLLCHRIHAPGRGIVLDFPVHLTVWENWLCGVAYALKTNRWAKHRRTCRSTDFARKLAAFLRENCEGRLEVITPPSLRLPGVLTLRFASGEEKRSYVDHMARHRFSFFDPAKWEQLWEKELVLVVDWEVQRAQVDRFKRRTVEWCGKN